MAHLLYFPKQQPLGEQTPDEFIAACRGSVLYGIDLALSWGKVDKVASSNFCFIDIVSVHFSYRGRTLEGQLIAEDPSTSRGIRDKYSGEPLILPTTVARNIAAYMLHFLPCPEVIIYGPQSRRQMLDRVSFEEARTAFPAAEFLPLLF